MCTSRGGVIGGRVLKYSIRGGDLLEVCCGKLHSNEYVSDTRLNVIGRDDLEELPDDVERPVRDRPAPVPLRHAALPHVLRELLLQLAEGSFCIGGF